MKFFQHYANFTKSYDELFMSQPDPDERDRAETGVNYYRLDHKSTLIIILIFRCILTFITLIIIPLVVYYHDCELPFDARSWLDLSTWWDEV